MKKDNYNSPRVSSQFIFCPFPFVIDSYAGCPQHCRYCFAYWNSLINQAKCRNAFADDSKTINSEHLERILSGNPRNKVEIELCEFVKRRIPIHWGGVSEPFSCFEKTHGTSLKILKLLEKYKYPFIVSTKNHRIVEGEYWETLKRCKYKVVQVSLISLRPELEKFEPHPEITIVKRLDIIRKCAKEGMRVVVRLQPFIPVFCEKGLERFIKKVSDLGAKAITMEYLKLPVIQIPVIKKAILELSKHLGYNINDFYRRLGEKTATDFEMKAGFKRSWLLKTKALSHKYGLEFYSSDNQFRGLGDSSICCGVGNEKGFKPCNETRTGRIFEIKKETITLQDILKDEELLKKINRHWLNASNAYKGARNKNMSLLDEFKTVWNNPKSALAPCNFYIGINYIGRDKDGNAIYAKSRQKTPKIIR